MTRRLTILLCILALLLGGIASDPGDPDDGADSSTGVTVEQAIETASAVQLYAQLTAIAPIGPKFAQVTPAP